MFPALLLLAKFSTDAIFAFFSGYDFYKTVSINVDRSILLYSMFWLNFSFVAAGFVPLGLLRGDEHSSDSCAMIFFACSGSNLLFRGSKFDFFLKFGFISFVKGRQTHYRTAKVIRSPKT